MSYSLLEGGRCGFYFGAEIGSGDAASFKADLARIEAKRPADLLVEFNSQGGDAVAAFAIGAALTSFAQRTQARVQTRNVAIVASAALIPYMAGSDRVAVSGSFFAVHELDGSASAQDMARLRAQYVEAIANKATLPAAEISSAMRESTLYTATEALAAGFATRLVAGAPIAAVGRLSPAVARAAQQRTAFSALWTQSIYSRRADGYGRHVR